MLFYIIDNHLFAKPYFAYLWLEVSQLLKWQSWHTFDENTQILHTFVNPIIPDLQALYGANPGPLITPIMEAMFIILPQPEMYLIHIVSAFRIYCVLHNQLRKISKER